MNTNRMYILIRRKVPRGWGVNAVGHAALMCYLKFEKEPEVQAWVKESFRKVTCLVSDEEFEYSKKAGHYVVFREDDLDNMVCAIAFKPRGKYPFYFKGFPLYS